MSKLVTIEEIVPVIKEQMKNDGKVSFTPKGNSMLPLFRNNMDVVILSKPQFPLKKYSIAFYQRENGRYVLHRVIGRKNQKYTMRGDNQYRNEPGISGEQIIAVVTEFVRNGKACEVTNRRYQLYCICWTNTVYIRMIYKIIRHTVGKVKRKILRKMRR